MNPKKFSVIGRLVPPLALFSFVLAFTVFSLYAFPREPSSSPRRVKLGNELFLHNTIKELQSKRLALVLNHTSVLPDGTPLAKALLERGIRIQAIFSPEHGFQGIKEGGSEVNDSLFKGFPIYSLYGKIRKPTPAQLRGTDALVYDIQDIGTRFYTYITTLKYVLEAAAEAGLPVYVLDRPNPAGGVIVEGPLLQPAFESFIGALPIPVRYGLTPGELALMMKGEDWVPEKVDLHVVRMEGWTRSFFWEDTGLPWIPPSPNIPSAETALIFSGTAFLGGLILNPGLGTPLPYLQFGAPWLDSCRIIQELQKGENFGIQLEPVTYTPHSLPGKTLQPAYENRVCQGIRVGIQQKSSFRALHFALELIRIIKKNHPDRLSPASRSLNLMFGCSLLDRYLKDEISYTKLLASIDKDESLFLQKRRKYLLYE